MKVFNVMEQVVRDVVLNYQNELHLACTCERCLKDIMAITLNKMPPRYIVDDQHSPVIRVSHEADRHGATQVLMAVTQAAVIVNKSPNCGFEPDSMKEKQQQESK